jgi:hypothetical protein
MVISVIKLTRKLLNNLTIHKLDKLRQFSSVGFVVALKLSPFIGAHFKTWHTKTFLWLTANGCARSCGCHFRGLLTLDEHKTFSDATFLFVGFLLSVIGDNLVNVYCWKTNTGYPHELATKF